MIISESWLRELVNPDIDADALAHKLTMAGLEVDSVSLAAPEFKGVKVGQVISVEPHSDADRLRVCQVDVGDNEPLNIVCGAANVRTGLHIPVATVGAVLPGNFKIKKSKLRGVPSFGMLCSEKELGLAEQAEGLMELPDDAPVGQDIRDYLDLNDTLIEVDLTPNRGDCLGMSGIAREVGVLTRTALLPAVTSEAAASIKDEFLVQVSEPEVCPRYLGRVVRAVDATARSPLWLQERLRRSGIRSLNAIVDATNYVLLAYGQPMHAFDLARLSGGINVRYATDGDQLTLLDGRSVEPTDNTLLITDDNGPLALAGIMGGQDSAVSDDTTDVFLECAHFVPTVIAGRARSLNMQTDSSFRFERGVNPDACSEVMEAATQLILDLCGGKAGPVTESGDMDALAAPETIILRKDRLKRVLGVSIDDSEVMDILRRLGMQVTPNDSGWQVISPRFRFDISIEADLIEEVGRIYGYDQLPSAPGQGSLVMSPQPEGRVAVDTMHELLIRRDYQEVVTYSFVDPALQNELMPDEQAIELANPLSSEMSVMRTSLWPGLLLTLTYNLKRQHDRIRLFESGLKFVRQDNEIKQELMLSGLIYGAREAENWSSQSESVDFFDLKSDLESIFQLTGRLEDFIFNAKGHPALHPGQSACIQIDNKQVGWIGALHPAIQQNHQISDNVFVFELNISALGLARIPLFSPLSKFPSVRRDLAIVVDETVSAGQILADIRALNNDKLINITLFDVYQGKGVELGRKSLALGLILQETSRTLTDNDCDEVVQAVLAVLQKRYNATLRI
ncbi:MAG TPA: phenylalanine--tRNA ligase subunit beta [Gammaproteobacteria bacterium]|nr:phenylalanine--tRNA ligase subunit beta [Gammaproteobacteria bacterium]